MKYFKNIIIIFILAYGCSSQSTSNVDKAEPHSYPFADTAKKNSISLTDSILVIDTILAKGTFKLIWYSNGQIKASLNNMTATRKFFPYEELIKNKSHQSLVLSANILTNFIIEKDYLLFSLTDFKGRANIFGIHFSNGKMFFYTSQSPFLNPIVNESSYLFVDVKNNIILNSSKRKVIDVDINPQGWDFYIFNYTDSTFYRNKKVFISNIDLKIDNDLQLNSSNVFLFYQSVFEKLKREQIIQR